MAGSISRHTECGLLGGRGRSLEGSRFNARLKT